jgi:rod shape determining protein RodA
MLVIDKRIFTHFDFLLIFLLVPIVGLSYYLISDAVGELGRKQLIYITVGIVAFLIAFFLPIRRIKWIIPYFYWSMLILLVMVELFGISKLGAQRWLEIPFTNFTIQPSEFMKPAMILMLCYWISENPPNEDGYDLKKFLIASLYIVVPFFLIAKEPDLGTALVLLLVGYGILLVVGVNYKIWISIIVILGVSAPIIYSSMLHDYQKKRIKDFLAEEPHYHVKQSIIAIGSGGISGKPKDNATQTKLKFLPIATSDFIFAYYVERFGFLGVLGLFFIYIILILHLLMIAYTSKKDYFLKVFSSGICFMLFIYMGVNIAMTIGYAPVVGLPLPMFSYGGTSFVTFMFLFGILENLLAFRYNYMYNIGLKTRIN